MLKKYIQDTSGNFAIMFAVCLALMMGAVGAAVDMNGLSSKKNSDQSLADAAVLAAARSGETDIKKLTVIANAIVTANGSVGDKYTTHVTISKKGIIRVQLDSQYDTVLMGMFGKPNFELEMIAEAPIASADPVDIVLVLDTTGSMSGDKIKSLKTAAIGLIDQLEAYKNDNIRVSVVPFQNYVNVGVSRRNRNWLDVEEDSSKPGAEVCYMRSDVISRTNCRTVQRTCTNDGVSYSCSSTVCDYKYGPQYNYCYIPTISRTWYGCVGSRLAPWNNRVKKGATRMPGIMNVSCGEELQPLTSDMSVVRKKLDGLTVGQETYMPAGLMWGWRTVHPSVPFTQARANNVSNKIRVMIFMTDGGNTKSQSNLDHNGWDEDDANTRSRKLCNRIKKNNVQLYTVAYEFEGAGTLNLLKKCASKPEMFFLAKDGDALQKAFKDIGSNLIKLRLTH